MYSIYITLNFLRTV